MGPWLKPRQRSRGSQHWYEVRGWRRILPLIIKLRTPNGRTDAWFGPIFYNKVTSLTFGICMEFWWPLDSFGESSYSYDLFGSFWYLFIFSNILNFAENLWLFFVAISMWSIMNQSKLDLVRLQDGRMLLFFTNCTRFGSPFTFDRHRKTGLRAVLEDSARCKLSEKVNTNGWQKCSYLLRGGEERSTPRYCSAQNFHGVRSFWVAVNVWPPSK